MSLKALDYLCAAVIYQARHGQHPSLDSLGVIQRHLDKYSANVDGKVIRRIGDRLVYLKFLQEINDDYAGHYYRPLYGTQIDNRISNLSSKEDGKDLKFAYHQGDSLFQRAFKNEQFWDDLEASAQDDALWRASTGGGSADLPVPAADRLVTLNDNQRTAIDAAAEELADCLGKENSIDGDVALRSRFLAQIAAARELIKAESVRAYLMYETLFRVLGSLIEKYKGHVIGEVSKKLLDLILTHIFGK